MNRALRHFRRLTLARTSSVADLNLTNVFERDPGRHSTCQGGA
jgi:hypothetical protein